MKKLIVRFVNDTEGQDLIEYALLGTLIALGCIGAMGSLGTIIDAQFDRIGATLASAS